jgi:hypothetical protein
MGWINCGTSTPVWTKLVFDKNVYAGLSGSTLTGSPGWAEAGATVANTASQRFIYNLSNGDLFFDPDGTGVLAATQIANLNRFNPAFPSDVASQRGFTQPGQQEFFADLSGLGSVISYGGCFIRLAQLIP